MSQSDETPLTDAALGRRAQILATEHWGLLAARSTAQSEVLVRITIFLALVSAGLITIGLLGQATRFGDWFPAAALAILGFLTLLGVLTQMRVLNVGEEDLMYVVAMNRLRVAYVDLDPGLEKYFLAATTDDRPGMERTYSFLRRRSLSHLLGSSVILIFVVNACVEALFVGGILTVVGAPFAWAAVLGIAVAIAAIVVSAWWAQRNFLATWRSYRPLRRSADAVPSARRATRGSPAPPLDSDSQPL